MCSVIHHSYVADGGTEDMVPISRFLGTLLASVFGIIVMVIVATVVFFIATFVVDTGASLAGLEPSGDFVVLAASLIVVAVILTGALTPRMTQQVMEFGEDRGHDPMYD